MRQKILAGFFLGLAGFFHACGDGPTVPGVPEAPTNLVATPHNAAVTVSWNAVNGADQYNLYWATTSGVTKQSGTRHSGVTSPFEHTGLINGTTYFYIVTAVNASGESRESAQVSAVLSNTAPTADAGIDQTVSTGVMVYLNGSGSNDREGDALEFTWTQILGRSVALSDPATANPTFPAPHSLGVFEFQLVVSDAHETSAPDTVSIAVDRFTRFEIASDVAPANSNTGEPGKLGAVMVGQNALFVSCRTLGSPVGLFGVVVDADGQVLQSFPISTHDCSFPSPSVASDGAGYLVVFQRGGQIVATRLSGPPGYGVLSEAVVSTGTSNWSPSVSFDGTDYFLVWNKFVGYPNGHDIYGARVGTNGQPTGEIPVFVQGGEQVLPSIAFDGVNYLVIWRDTRTGTGPSPDTDIFGVRVSASGVVLDPNGIAISTAANMQDWPHVTFDGSYYFAVWPDARRYPPQTQPPLDVFGTRISPTGALLDGPSETGGIAICTADVGYAVKLHPTAVFDGTQYFVVFSVVGFSPPAGIYYSRITSSGNLLDGPSDELGPPISGPPGSFSRLVYPAVVSNGVRSVVAWIDNIEASGEAKDIVGVIIDPF